MKYGTDIGFSIITKNEPMSLDTSSAVTTTAQTDHSENVEAIIKRHAMYAAGAGLIPIPIVDSAAIVGIQYKLTEAMANEYGVDFENNKVKVIITSIVSSLISRLASGAIQAAAGGITIPGIVGGSLTNAALAGYLTFSTGEILRLHFATGGTLENLELSHYLDFIESQFKEGKLHPKNFSTLSAFGYLI